ncbi:hypothetical protein SAY87_019524 [Trapa incisa]|uniref:Uncharacterized protein n=1 Tax=Trapa incisa TaxID=236973 RepID=A0AAN7Q2Q6_9MYRT|nr:hypothetical protein SAY87_019524 [Trapa incisa]
MLAVLCCDEDSLHSDMFTQLCKMKLFSAFWARSSNGRLNYLLEPTIQFSLPSYENSFGSSSPYDVRHLHALLQFILKDIALLSAGIFIGYSQSVVPCETYFIVSFILEVFQYLLFFFSSSITIFCAC